MTTPKRKRTEYRSYAIHRLAVRVRNHPRTNGAQIVKLGQLLVKACDLVGFRQFEPWLRSASPSYSLRAARYAIKAHRLWGHLPYSTLARLSPSSVDLLCTDSIISRPAIRTRIEELFGSSTGKIRWADVRSAISEVDPTAIYGEPESGNESAGEKLSRQLIDILMRDDTSQVWLSVDHDDDEPISRVTVFTGRGPTTFTRRHIAGAISAAAGEETQRFCRKCAKWLPQDQFSTNARNCKQCERKRVKEYEAKMKAKQSAA